MRHVHKPESSSTRDPTLFRSKLNKLGALEFRLLALASGRAIPETSPARPVRPPHVQTIDTCARAEITEMIQAMDCVQTTRERSGRTGAQLIRYAANDAFIADSFRLVQDWYTKEDHDLFAAQDHAIAGLKEHLAQGGDISIEDFQDLMTALQLDPQEVASDILGITQNISTPQS